MAFAEEPAIFARLGARYAGDVKRYFEYVRDNDLWKKPGPAAPPRPLRLLEIAVPSSDGSSIDV
ncbi:hypothetical protein [Streptomyces canus]|uniref:hypothetical protein n=1 Tax=Streptomyces canus TaxID=58343 RepID=UPI002DD8515F|nr:hypothetical protein [Streptomyces canus]WSD84154.1 hypothetical protein OG925_07565 [Streptomyces canus]